MAVKKHKKLVADDRNQLDLATLAKYLQIMNVQPGSLPPTQELIKHCQDIVNCLAHTAGTEEQLWGLLQPIEYFLLRVVTTVTSNVRHEILTTILHKLQSFLANPHLEACPAAAVVLIVLDESDEEAALSYARWLVSRSENDLEEAGLPAALSYLYKWLHEWPSSSALGFWLQCYIKALEEKDYHDLLIDTTINNLPRLFSCLTKLQPIYQNTANVIFHVLASLRESVKAFDRISPMVEYVLVNLAADSNQWSRQLLQDLVDILLAMFDCISSNLKGDEYDMFRDKYSSVILCLERHMASRTSKYIKVTVWRKRNNSDGGNNNTKTTKPRKGLMNLGNTCYMNSVVQALLVIRQFSTHVLCRAITVPYWEKMGELFAHMMFSNEVPVNPDNFFSILRPSFNLNNQQDSFEFLGYLFQLLQSYEHSKETNHDYSKPPVLMGANRRIVHSHVPQTPQPQSSTDEPSEPGQSQRSVSPRPGSSNGSGSSGLKRASPDSDDDQLVQRKRPRTSEGTYVSLRSDSVIDGMFAGVLLTRVQCTVCQSSFLSRDVFRDLQLAFPEKPEGCQHSVQSLLEYYCSKESLTGDNRYACNGCGALSDAERSVLIESTPKYLILVLKNFKFDPKVQLQTKLMHSVYYNHQVKLPTVRAQAQHSTFNLFAAIVHGGTSLDTGHYFTLAKDGDQWFEYDDCLVNCTDESRINKLNNISTPYILFYRRSDVEELAAPSFEELPRSLRDNISAGNKLHSERLRKLLGRP